MRIKKIDAKKRRNEGRRSKEIKGRMGRRTGEKIGLEIRGAEFVS